MRHTKLLLSLIAVGTLAACTDNGIFNPNQDFSGTYTLTVFAGKSVPATYTFQPGVDPDFPNGGTFVVNNGQLTLNNDGTFTETNNYTTTRSGQQPFDTQFFSSGNWNQNGTTISLFAPATQTDPARNVSGSLDVDTQGRATVFYQEVDAATGVVESYEYKR
jgi:hypothetical protein